MNKNFKILVLDGGGSKGMYTIGVLKELELKLGSALYNHFDLIYGTSTGSIIASLIALGKTIDEIKEIYDQFIPAIMSKWTRKGKSMALENAGKMIFNDLEFKDFKTDVGIVALNYENQQPLIFKSNVMQAHGMKHSFTEGFGCSISEAVQASCSAYPIFARKTINTITHGPITAIDGGFIANNATLFALIDADKAFRISNDNIRVCSIGTGSFKEKPMKGMIRYLRYIAFVKFIEKILMSSTNTNVKLAELLYSDIKILRINQTFNESLYATNMVEKDPKKLEKLFQLGRKSFALNERDVNNLFDF